MPRFTFLILCLLLTFVLAKGQISIQLKENPSSIETDNLGNVYVVTNSELKKYSGDGQFLYQYANAYLGNLSSIDVRNPLRIMLFFEESNTIVFLNKHLTELDTPIDLYDHTNIQASLACSSSEGGFWVLDAQKNTLVHFDEQKAQNKSTENLTEYLLNQTVYHLVENNQLLFLQTNKETHTFDIYGNKLASLPIATESKIMFIKNEILYFVDNKLNGYNKTTLSSRLLNLEIDDNCEMFITNKNFYLSYSNKTISIIKK